MSAYSPDFGDVCLEKKLQFYTRLDLHLSHRRAGIQSEMVMNADPLIPDLFIAHLGEALSLCQVGDPPTEMMTQDPACFISISDHFMFETQL